MDWLTRPCGRWLSLGVAVLISNVGDYLSRPIILNGSMILNRSVIFHGAAKYETNGLAKWDLIRRAVMEAVTHLQNLDKRASFSSWSGFRQEGQLFQSVRIPKQVTLCLLGTDLHAIGCGGFVKTLS